MALFGLKKSREVKEAREIIKELEKEERETEKVSIKEEAPVPEAKPEAEQKVASEFAPLFVRIDKYKQILQTMNYLKTTMNAVKSSLSILKELDTLRQENLKMVEDAVVKVEDRLAGLDSNFMRPSGFSEEVPELRHVENVEITLDDLKGQINQLKAQIEGFA
jgi:hypothetical protein